MRTGRQRRIHINRSAGPPHSTTLDVTCGHLEVGESRGHRNRATNHRNRVVDVVRQLMPRDRWEDRWFRLYVRGAGV